VADNLSDLVAIAAKENPDRAALLELEPFRSEPKRRISYRELDLLLDRVAAGAMAAGLKPGERMAIALGNSADFIIVVFGLLRAGVVPAIFDPRASAATFEFLLEDSGARGVFVDSISVAEMLKAADAADLDLRIEIGAVTGRQISLQQFASTAAPPKFVASEDSPAMILYTSGSTGRPKGVITRHRGHLAQCQNSKIHYASLFDSPPVNLVATPMFHTNGTGNAMIAFVNNGTFAILPKFEPRSMLQAIQDHRITTFFAVGAMLFGMMRENELLASLDLSSLEAVMAGAAPTGAALLDQAAHKLGTRIYQMYGATECGAVFGHVRDRTYTLDSCGLPLPGVEVMLMDEQGQPSARGELRVRSQAVALGYVNRPEDTAKRFRDGWYVTGDILERDDQGYYFFRGRTDDMFVCGGENIYPLEVEKVLLAHPAVHNACVAPIPHLAKGQAPAALVERRDPSVTDEELKIYYLANAPAYTHPRMIIFVDQLPLGATGKVDRKAAQARLLEAAQRHPASDLAGGQ
jgi:long-chain acyl-CoA synthetase